ncbi:MAG: YceI family protein [Ignavibacteriales bacterium]|nr:MAG: YceI family protein [Ignavibacteriaceae bacterium]MBW7872819.1 YceI family protein [Ignavibacteria bacterium]MCZ2143538.1 YceI family protein [Ignavibacteriales bacterium]OQY71838.1 MAG: hypothetical protein B6D45_09585 [Ignavibacteriales bacterium UTCHB3]MBV6444415.1 Protein YceI [Ignavibacteriaceae bacterium]
MSVVKCTTDPAHTRIGFRAKHMMFTDIYGKFTKYEMSIEFADEHFESGKFFFKADVASISTSEEKRDAHLRHSDFFDVEKYPYLTFSSTAIKKISDDRYIVTGDLTIKDVTQSIDLDVEYIGWRLDPWNNELAAAKLTGKINRKDFGMLWNAESETGGLFVSDEVWLEVQVVIKKIDA